MKKILKAMNHELTIKQLDELQELFGETKIFDLNTTNPNLFNNISRITLESNLNDLTNEFIKTIADSDIVILPIGSPAFMFMLAKKLSVCNDKRFLFAHTDRKVVEKTNEDGTVTKTSVFEHQKFIVL